MPCVYRVYSAKVADFGLARRLALSGSDALAEVDGYGPIHIMAPESLTEPYLASHASDAYMFGLLIWEVMEERAPFGEYSPYDAACMKLRRQCRPGIRSGIRLEGGGAGWDPEVVKVFEACTVYDWRGRPGLTSVVGQLEARLKPM